MNVFDILGPVMIGPSSSHTAGAVRLGRVVNKLINDTIPRRVVITLSGSFATTYKGHGTDRALLAGVMGYRTHSKEIRDALQIARDKGIEYEFRTEHIRDAHPNTARIDYTLEDGSEGMMQGASVGGGNILVDQINGMHVKFTGEKNTLLVMHKDKPGVIAAVTNIIHWNYRDLNISNFHLSRENRGGNAIMAIEVDSMPPYELLGDIRRLEYVTNALLIRKI